MNSYKRGPASVSISLSARRSIGIKLSAVIFGVATLIPSLAMADPDKDTKLRSEPARVLSVTHMLPSPLPLPAGALVLGSSVAYGIAGVADISTDLLRDFSGFLNAGLKVGVLAESDVAAALTGGWERTNAQELSPSFPDLTLESYLLGGVVGVQTDRNMAWFVGGNGSFTRGSIPMGIAAQNGWARGASAETDFSWTYGQGNAMSTGLSYDFTYDLFGVGLSHHWPGMQIGFHYYPEAKSNSVVPIFGFGVAVPL